MTATNMCSNFGGFICSPPLILAYYPCFKGFWAHYPLSRVRSLFLGFDPCYGSTSLLTPIFPIFPGIYRHYCLTGKTTKLTASVLTTTLSCTMCSCCWLFLTNPTFRLVGQSGLLWPFLPHRKQVGTNVLCSPCFCHWFSEPEDFWRVGWGLLPMEPAPRRGTCLGESSHLSCVCGSCWPSIYRYLDWKGLLCLVAWCSSKMLAASRSDLGILFRTYSASPVNHNDKNLTPYSRHAALHLAMSWRSLFEEASIAHAAFLG